MATAGAFMFGLGAIPLGYLKELGEKTFGYLSGRIGVCCFDNSSAKTIFQFTVGLAVLGVCQVSTIQQD
ncbi:MAG: hypothetical protein Ct9H300mP2_5060 [Candidatus Neomarinimicrobiota bacterium]|nr:MAG: hypothetical protein Ct9H300mP2_5060 [Candidatus Neomarinimicrobiota bacterium]